MNKIKKEIASMLKENTGASMLDSGSAYGRHYERNQQVEDFESTEPFEVQVDKDYIFLTYNIYHYLTTYLDINEQVLNLRKKFNKFEKTTDQNDSWKTVVNDFLIQGLDFEPRSWINTYNSENILGQVLHYTTFNLEHEGDWLLDDLIFLQIHNGCDVRGGYTKPRLFHLPDLEYFEMAKYDIDAFCENCEIRGFSDDAGYHFYDIDFEIKRKNEKFKAVCSTCNGEISFSPRLSY